MLTWHYAIQVCDTKYVNQRTFMQALQIKIAGLVTSSEAALELLLLASS